MTNDQYSHKEVLTALSNAANMAWRRVMAVAESTQVPEAVATTSLGVALLKLDQRLWLLSVESANRMLSTDVLAGIQPLLTPTVTQYILSAYAATKFLVTKELGAVSDDDIIEAMYAGCLSVPTVTSTAEIAKSTQEEIAAAVSDGFDMYGTLAGFNLNTVDETVVTKLRNSPLMIMVLLITFNKVVS